MSNENLKKAIEGLKQSAKNVATEAKNSNLDLDPKELLNEKELNEILGGTSDSGSGTGGCSDYCGIHF